MPVANRECVRVMYIIPGPYVNDKAMRLSQELSAFLQSFIFLYLIDNAMAVLLFKVEFEYLEDYYEMCYETVITNIMTVI